MLALTRGGRPETITADRLLLATGRRPNTEGLGLSAVGVAQDASGAIVVDDRMRTSRAGVYAAGDVTGRDQFVYMAAYGAKLAARNALNGNSLRYDSSAMPVVVFTDPQVANVASLKRGRVLLATMYGPRSSRSTTCRVPLPRATRAA
jgi:mercuric reductase